MASTKLKQGALSLAAWSWSAFTLAVGETRQKYAKATFVLLVLTGACGRADAKHETVLTFSGSALGAEGTLVAKQLKRFMQLNPDIRVELQRTPDDASQRHQLYVQWLNARVGNPSILQLDVVWTPEFAAAGWVLPQIGRAHV